MPLLALSTQELLSVPADPLFPNCLRFWFHMFGVDVGSLRLLLASASGDHLVWSLTGDAGNAWFRGAVTLSEPLPFRVSKIKPRIPFTTE